MHKLSAVAAGLGLLLAGCSTGSPPQDPAGSVAKGVSLVFELVCMPAVLDGQDFSTLAKARLLTPMAPATRPGETGLTYRLGLTAVSATCWQDGSCVVASQAGDGEQLRALTLASLQQRGHMMKPGQYGQPAANDGVGMVYCTAEASPLVLAVATPGSSSSNAHALVATLYRSGGEAVDACLSN